MGEEKKNQQTQKKDIAPEEKLRENNIKEIKENESKIKNAPEENINTKIEDEVKEVKDENIENEKVKQEEIKIKKQSLISIILITSIICFLIVFSVIFALGNINNNKIMQGVSIMGVDVSKMSAEEAKEELNKTVENKLTEDLNLKYKEYETSITAKQLSGKFDIENAVNQAYNIGRDGNIVTNNYAIILTKLFKKNIEMPLYLDEEILNQKIGDISNKIPDAVKQSSYYIEDEELIIVKGKSGIIVEEEQLKDIVKREISQINSKYDIIDIPTKKVEPEPINVEKIREEIYKKPQNAYVSKNPTKVHTHVNGVDFKISIEKAKKMVKEDKKEYVIPLKITIPEKTINDLGKEAFPQLLATYTTRYDPSNYNRSNNLSLAASKINGTIVMPGEIFSYNKVVGARTIQAGYKLAGAYAGGKVVQDVGGGICQVSSTLYNTALLANLEIKDRTNHLFQSSYVAASRDATVSWGSLDFKFKNSRTYPIKIVASAKSGVCKISMYGIKEETEYEVIIQSKILSYIPYTVKYEEDSSLKEGREVVEQSGHNGCKSEAYRILKKNGKIVSKTLLGRDTYSPMQRIVRKGTKKQTVSTNKNDKTSNEKQTSNEIDNKKPTT